ncbi:hypothetical protein H6F89_23145 [Cyanobacteria bacterium FACHB-63]|nr:hypothetical protein [Cyanobacteria bacterium FACHB-63]
MAEIVKRQFCHRGKQFGAMLDRDYQGQSTIIENAKQLSSEGFCLNEIKV